MKNQVYCIAMFDRILNDKRLNVWHIALLLAILKLSYLQNSDKIVKVSRTKIMKLSHIHTIPTYHKYFKELQMLGYFNYTPSYHPGVRSFVELKFMK